MQIAKKRSFLNKSTVGLPGFIVSHEQEYIKTGLSYSKTTKAEIVGKFISGYSIKDWLGVFGACNGDKRNGCRLRFYQNACALAMTWDSDLEWNFTTSEMSTYNVFEEHKYFIDSVQNKFYVDDIQATNQSFIGWFSPAGITAEMYLFIINFNSTVSSSDFPSPFAMRSCKIWDGDLLLRNYVPYYKNEEYGMFDLIYKKFYRNDSGNGAFTYLKQ